MERKISVFVLIILLAVTLKVRLMINANGVPTQTVNGKALTDKSNIDLENGSVSTREIDENTRLTEAYGPVSYEEIRKYVDHRIGSFKSASYKPNSVSIRKYDHGQTAVKNSLIDITYQTSTGEYHRQVRKIDVFVRNGVKWVKIEKDPLRSVSVAAL